MKATIISKGRGTIMKEVAILSCLGDENEYEKHMLIKHDNKHDDNVTFNAWVR